MAQPTNIVDTVGLVGIREDLSDVIYNISPEDTPFLSACAKTKATSTLHEWQTDTLRASAANAHVEGDDTVAETRTATVRLNNRTQIFKNAVATSGTEAAVTKAGRAKEMAYQSRMVLKEQKLDIEAALFANQAKVTGTSSVAARLAGACAWITTNVNNVGSGGANPTGDGSDARTDGTGTAFAQADFDTTMQEIWTEGGRAKTKSVYLSPTHMNTALGFTGNNNQRSTIAAKDGDVVNNMGMYVTPWGQVKFTMSLEARATDVWIMTDDMWSIATLRPTKNEALAKTGDSEKRQIVTELTLCCKNEKAHGLVSDCS
jgi:hypothetical protein